MVRFHLQDLPTDPYLVGSPSNNQHCHLLKVNRQITFEKKRNDQDILYLYEPKMLIDQTHTSEVKLNHFYIWYSYWWFCNSFFVIIVPLASQAFCFIPYLYEILIILNNYIVFVKFSIQVRFGTTLVIQDVKFVLSPASLGCYINTVVLIYGSLKFQCKCKYNPYKTFQNIIY